MSRHSSTAADPSGSKIILEAARLCGELKGWLHDDAYRLWWSLGADRVHGGFHESLQQDGRPTGAPRRARLHPRQMYAFGLAEELGWDGPADAAIRHALEFFLDHYPRPDTSFFRTLVREDGSALDERVTLYDQAFALLGMAAAQGTLKDASLRDRARSLMTLLRERLGHTDGGFEESSPRVLPLSSNSHMHLFEATLEWMTHDIDGEWREHAERIVELATARFIDSKSGFLLEFFDEHWHPAAHQAGQRVEPGHQFEWGWLLLRWAQLTQNSSARTVGLGLIDLGERHGIDGIHGVALNALHSDGSVLDARARLWPQTERLKAALLAAETTGAERYWTAAVQAAQALLRYLDVPMPGLWRDSLEISGEFSNEPAPASSFYHITAAIAQFDRTLQQIGCAASDRSHTRLVRPV